MRSASRSSEPAGPDRPPSRTMQVSAGRTRVPAAIPVILNCSSGTGHGTEQTARLEALFREAGLQARILCPAEGESLGEVAAREAQARPPLIVAGGGDGTISA